MTIHNDGIPKGGTWISDGGTTIYNSNIHQNIFWSYNYNKNIVAQESQAKEKVVATNEVLQKFVEVVKKG